MSGAKSSDVDLDGRSDIIAGSYDGYVYILDGVNKNIKWKSPNFGQYGGMGLAVSDIDKDGIPNILITNYVPSDNVYFYDYQYNRMTETYDLLRQVNKTGDGYVHTLAAADINNDGNTEVLIPDYSASIVYVYGLINGTYNY